MAENAPSTEVLIPSLPLGGQYDTRARFGVGRRVVVT